MMENKVVVKVYCPDCGQTAVTNINRFVVFYPKAVKALPYAQVTCESCGKVYPVGLSWEKARLFEKKGCPVVGFSMERDKKVTELDIIEFMANFDERMEDFLDEYTENGF